MRAPGRWRRHTLARVTRLRSPPTSEAAPPSMRLLPLSPRCIPTRTRVTTTPFDKPSVPVGSPRKLGSSETPRAGRVRMPDLLPSWRAGRAKDAIVAFVERVHGARTSTPVPVEERIAVFDNDGTLWCEKPMPIQLDFILGRLVEMAEERADLRDRQPWKAAYEHDYGWLADLVTEHYAGDDTNVRVATTGVLEAFE